MNMQVPTLGALFQVDKTITKDVILRMIVRKLMSSLFIRRHLRREQVIGTIGEKGGGKSATTSTLALLDQMFDGKPVHSNIDIVCDVVVSDSIANNYGLKSGGKVHYESIPLEKNALLKLDERYRKSAIVIEEINVQYSNVRRFMTNTNVDFNEVVQQLRHLMTTLYYNVIDEMFIDPQLRSMTDAFIKCEDTAYSSDNLINKRPQGETFKWLIYPMTGPIAGHEKTYFKTKKPLPPEYFHFTKFQGIFNTEYSQRKGIYSQSRKTKNGDIDMMLSVESSPEMENELNKWNWLAEKAIELKSRGIKELVAWELWQHLGLAERDINPRQQDFQSYLEVWGIRKTGKRNKYGERIYTISDFNINEKMGVTDGQTAVESL